jgi:hypothetical protein
MIAKAALLTQIVKVDEQAKMVLLNVDLVIVAADGLQPCGGSLPVARTYSIRRSRF